MHRVTLLGPALLALLLAAGCGREDKAAQPKGAAPPPPTVVATVLQPTTVPLYSEFVAQTYSQDMVEVRARVDGFIEKKGFTSGQLVKPGDVLFVLDLRPYQAAVDQAKAGLADAVAKLQFATEQVEVIEAEGQLAQAQADLVRYQQDVARYEPLVRQDAAPRQDLENAIQYRTASAAVVKAREANLQQKRLSTRTKIEAAQAGVDAARASLRSAELNLEYATIKATIAGRIGDSQVEVGGLVTKNSPQPLTTIVPLEPISARVRISEAEYLQFARPQTRSAGSGPLQLILADDSIHPAPGELKRILNQVDPRTGTLEVQADFPNPDGRVLPGQFGRVRAKVGERQNALLVPQRAIVDLQGTRSVYTVDADGKVAVRSIVTADRLPEGVVVEQGLKPGDRVIVDGVQKVRPGITVQVQEPAPDKGKPGQPAKGPGAPRPADAGKK